MKVTFLVKGDERKAVVVACAEAFQDGMTLKAKRFGNGLYVVEGIAVSDGLEGAKALSEFLDSVDKKLGRVKKGVRAFRILADDASALFGELLYPVLCEFEVRLRAAIHVAVCADEDNFDDELVATLGNSTLERLRQQLFDDYFVPKVEKALKDKDLNKQKLLSYVESLQEGCIWEKLFAGDELRAVHDGFEQIKKLRNDVMHFHTISYKAYARGKEVLESANAELGVYVDHALADDHYPASKEAAAQAASRQLAGNYAALISSISNRANAASYLGGNLGQLQGISSALEKYAEIGKPARSAMDEALAACDFSGITTALSQIDFNGLAGGIPALDVSQNPAYKNAVEEISEAAAAATRDVCQEISEAASSVSQGVGKRASEKLAAEVREALAETLLVQGRDNDAGNVDAGVEEGKDFDESVGLDSFKGNYG